MGFWFLLVLRQFGAAKPSGPDETSLTKELFSYITETCHVRRDLQFITCHVSSNFLKVKERVSENVLQVFFFSFLLMNLPRFYVYGRR